MERGLNPPCSFPPPWRVAVLHGADARRSPVDYRVRPLEYEPAIPCKCQPKAAQFISWSDENPGMRFVMCKLAKGGCDFFDWVDPPPSPFTKELLVDLRNKVRELQMKNYELYWTQVWGIADAEDALTLAELEHTEKLHTKEKELAVQKAEKFELKEKIRKERMLFGAFGAAMVAAYVKTWDK